MFIMSFQGAFQHVTKFIPSLLFAFELSSAKARINVKLSFGVANRKTPIKEKESLSLSDTSKIVAVVY